MALTYCEKLWPFVFVFGLWGYELYIPEIHQ